MAEIRLFQSGDLDGVIALCAAEGWPSFPEDPARALRALTAPGVTTVVAADDGQIAGFAQLLSDGEIQAHLSLIAVERAYRRRNLAREMLRFALARAGGSRIDLITETASAFYAALPHRRLEGFRIWPQIDKLPE